MSKCIGCEELIRSGDRVTRMRRVYPDGSVRFEWHAECLIRSLLGGINHLQRRCTCCGGAAPPDPPGLTRREAALLVLRWQERGAPWAC